MSPPPPPPPPAPCCRGIMYALKARDKLHKREKDAKKERKEERERRGRDDAAYHTGGGGGEGDRRQPATVSRGAQVRERGSYAYGGTLSDQDSLNSGHPLYKGCFFLPKCHFCVLYYPRNKDTSLIRTLFLSQGCPD